MASPPGGRRGGVGLHGWLAEVEYGQGGATVRTCESGGGDDEKMPLWIEARLRTQARAVRDLDSLLIAFVAQPTGHRTFAISQLPCRHAERQRDPLQRVNPWHPVSDLDVGDRRERLTRLGR